MKFLIAGLGSIGRRHLRNLIALGENDILLYRTHQSTLPDDDLRGYPVEMDLQDALAQEPDAVIISNPTALHLEVAIPAAEAGCHILMEKPISHSLEGIGELQDALRRGGGKLLVGFQFRYNPGLQLIRQILSSHTPTHLPVDPVGRPLSFHVHWGEYLPNWHPWEDYRQGYAARLDLGGGVVLTLCHPLDYLRWLLGEVNSLWAFSGSLGEIGVSVEDTAEIGLRFTSGVIGSLHLDYNQRPPAHRLEIVGTRGTIRWDNADSSVCVYPASTDEWQTFPAPAGFERNAMFLDQMRHFLALVRGEAEPLCTLEDGIKALELALAVHQSAQDGQMVKL